MRKSVTAAAMAASLTIGGAAGAVLFVPTLSGAQADETPTDETAADTNPAPDHGDGFLPDALAPLVEDGTITRAQADAVIEAIRSARPEGGLVGRRFPFGAALVDVLGLDADELRDALAGGKTIAEIAEAEGVAIDDVVAALVAEEQERLDQAVADGRLSQTEADQRAAELTERITGMVNGDLGPRMDPGRHGRGGPFGDRPGAESTDDGTTGS